MRHLLRGTLFRIATAATLITSVVWEDSASAQAEKYEATVFEVRADGSMTRTKRTVDRAVRMVSRSSYEAELEAAGFRVAHPARGKQAPRTREQATAARTEQVLDMADRMGALDRVDVLVELQRIPFPELESFDPEDPAGRHRLLKQREAVVLTAQEDFVKHARLNGAEDVRSMRLTNHVRLRAPASALVRIINHPDVVGISNNGDSALADVDGYSGLQIREQTFLQDFLDAGFDGESGGRATTAYGSNDIKIAVIEAWDLFLDVDGDGIPEFIPNDINDTHNGWKDCATCGSRIVVNQRCSNGCTPLRRRRWHRTGR